MTSQPLRETYETLRDRSIAGDLHASCRLAVELDRCSDLSLNKIRAVIDTWNVSATTASTGSAEATRAARNRDGAQGALDRELAHCDGTPKVPDEPAWKYLFNAASNGHLPSMLRFAKHPPLDPNSEGDREGMVLYQQNAGHFLERVARTGNRAAIAVLAAAYQGRPIPMLSQQVTPVDLSLALRYVIVTDRLNVVGANTTYGVSGSMAAVKGLLSPEQIETATREADEFIREIEAASQTPGFDDVVDLRLMTDGRDCG